MFNIPKWCTAVRHTGTTMKCIQNLKLWFSGCRVPTVNCCIPSCWCQRSWHLCISLPLPLYHPLRLPSQHTNNIRHQPGWRGDLPVHRREQCRLHTGQCAPHGALGWWAARFAHSRERWGPFTHHHPGVLEGARSEHSGHHRLCAPHPQDLRWGCSKDIKSHMHVACTRDLDD